MARRAALLLPLVLAAGACVAGPVPPEPPLFAALGCGPGLQEAVTLSAYFGRNSLVRGVERERVSDASWAAFRREEILPRFPEGSTVAEGVGQWDGSPRTERSKVLTVVVPAGQVTERLAALLAAADAYKRRFDQQSVGLALTPACVTGFWPEEDEALPEPPPTRS